MRLRLTMLFVLLAALCVGLLSRGPGSSTTAAKAAPAPAEANAGAKRTGDVIVRFKPAATLLAVGDAITASETEAKASTGGSRLVLLDPQPGQSVDDAVAQLRSNPEVEFAEPDILVSAAVTTPNDTYYATYQWPLTQTGVNTAWDTTTGSASVIVAVIDTGVQSTHPDLSGKVVAGYNYAAEPDTTNAADDNGHGTFVAGIIGASSNNSAGMAGVCWLCKIMPVKVLDSTGAGSVFNTSQGIDWAVANGAKVLNLSLGSTTGTAALQASVDNAWNNGRIVVAASGNENTTVLYPAAYPHALAVGATNSAGFRSTFSNWGPELDLMAPGEGVLSTACSTCAGYSYGTGSGTSFAAPHVAGVAALMASAGITDRDTIINTLKSTATDMCTAGADNVTGAGRVNAAKAVANSNVAVGATQCPSMSQSWLGNTIPVTPAGNATFTGNVTIGNAGSLTWPATGGSAVQFSYHWLNTDAGGACTTTAVQDGLRTSLPANLALGGTVTIAAQFQAPPAAGTYCLKLDMIQGATWFSATGALMGSKTVYVQAPVSTATPTSTSTPAATPTATATPVAAPAYGASWGADTTGATMNTGATSVVNVSFTNTGSMTWLASGANPVRLSYHWRNGVCPGTSSAVFDGLRTSLPGDIATGGVVTNLPVSVKAPSTPGTYCLQYDLVREGITWFSNQGVAMNQKTVTVSTPVYGVTWGAETTPSSMVLSRSYPITISFTNGGSLTWLASGANPVRLAYHWRNGACAGTSNAVWDGVRTALPGNVAAGGAVNNLAGTVTAPASAGTYCLQYDLVREGIAWFSNQGASMRSTTVTVSVPVYNVSWGAHNTPATMAANSTNLLAISLTNSGSLTWAAGGANPVHLSYHWRNGACPGTSAAVFDGVRSNFAADVAPSATVSALPVTVAAPAAAGTYCLQYDLVREGITWFSWQGASPLAVTVTIN